MTRHKNRGMYVLLFILLALATFVRVYRTNEVLGFYFDQGRDALVVANFLENGKLFLIGPTTGIAGIFRGPFYYYLIAPFYFFGQGNPVYSAVFLELSSVFALLLLFHIGREIQDRTTGILAVLLGGFSYYIVYASRWLSNPTPMLLLSMLLFYCMILIQKGKHWAWVPLSFIAGSSLFHFGSSGEFFYFPALLIFALWQWGVFKWNLHFPSLKIVVGSSIAFFITVLPLMVFDFRHEHILLHNIIAFFGVDGSFGATSSIVLSKRISFLVDSVYYKFFLEQTVFPVVVMLIALSFGVVHFNKLFKNKYIRSLLLLVVAPFVGFLFFKGNEGNVYDYYLTGYYLLFVLVIAICLRQLLTLNFLGPIFVFIFLTLFLKQNIPSILYDMNNQLDGPNSVAFGNEKKAVEWVYQNAKGDEFNADEYVPPVIQYSYQYLFHWYDLQKKAVGYTEKNSPLLYTIYEVDPPHPERLEAWLSRQEGIGIVQEKIRFGGITVERRVRKDS